MLSQLIDHGFDLKRLTPPRSGMNLHCMAVSAGYEQRRNEHYSWDGMKRGTAPFLVLQHTTFGEGILEYAGVRHKLTPGKTMLVTMPHDHHYFLDRGGHWEYFWMVISGREAMRLALEILSHAGPVLTLSESEIDRLVATTLACLTTPSVSPGQAASLGYAALTTLHDAAFRAHAHSAQTHPPAIDRVITYVEDNLASELHVDRLAGLAGMSRAHFVRSFTAAVGTPPSTYVLERRIARAERLLLATEMSVVDIAAMTGFADGNYFAKVFRRVRNTAPLAHRATRFEAA
ncbi:helix-turn-helix transcriptional regulator [Devosia sp. WQ 349]|uniref:helix-turn-helix domain-containing protein n=1 Tax=Devosia sp. WQ 349K1 TaxID=2800329 RepID=UPI0019080B22|nr:AraC family transcriptional regulator [Devosia sp. WQ 349K1]MBK1794366.1 helix-turn-helix transcriptional regulator [Devosia sp. WQ 349K1]